MRVGNDPEWDSKSPMAGLLKLQTEFYTRLTEETLKYLRHIQAASLPSTPGTVLLPRPARPATLWSCNSRLRTVSVFIAW